MHTFEPEELNLSTPISTTIEVTLPQTERSKAGLEKVEPLLERFHVLSRRYRRQARNLICFTLCGAMVIPIVDTFAVLALTRHGVESLAFTVIFAVWLLYLFGMFAFGLPALVSTLARRRVRDTLSHHDDVRVVGPLAEMLCASEPDFRQAVSKALGTQLHRLKASDTDLLDADQRTALSLVLRSADPGDTELILAILKAFEQVGDESALPFVKRLAEYRGKSRRRQLLRDAAAQCLPVLSERADQKRDYTTLLRAGCAPNPPEHLLRSVTGVASNDVTHLLRASQKQGVGKTGYRV